VNGRRLVIGFVAFVTLFAGALVYFQFFAFYERMDRYPPLVIGGQTVELEGFEGISAESSPLKLRGCFRVDPGVLAALPVAEDPTPLTPPPWFRCFDAEAIQMAIDAGEADAFLLAADAPDGFDVMLAVFPDGRGYLWRQLSSRFRNQR
jgi:hypothetical protein